MQGIGPIERLLEETKYGSGPPHQTEISENRLASETEIKLEREI